MKLTINNALYLGNNSLGFSLEEHSKFDRFDIDEGYETTMFLEDYRFKRKRKSYRKKQSIIDLHTHTYYSDGELSPNGLINLATTKGIGTIAITDHDTLLGNKAIDYSKIGNIEVISGVELSAKIDKGRMHILGYGIDINDEALNKKMLLLKENSIYFVSLILRQIEKDFDITFPKSEVDKLLESPCNIGRPDIAKLFLKYQYVTSLQEAFEKYLIIAGEKVRNKKKWFNCEECFEAIINAGGIPVLAHPNSLKLNEKDLLIKLKEMIEYGLKGIEVYHSSHSEIATLYFQNIADELGLLQSGGSDYHGSIFHSNVELGSGKDRNLNIRELSILKELRKTKNQ